MRQHAAPLERGIHAQRNAHQQRDQRGHQRQFQRGGQTLGNQRRHFAALAQADAKFTLYRVADEAGELHHKGLVQPQVGPQLLALLHRGVLPHQVGDRVTDKLKQHEGNESHREHHDHGLQQTAEDESQHADAGTRQVRRDRW